MKATAVGRLIRVGPGVRLRLVSSLAALGLLALGVAPAQAAPFAYVPNFLDATVSVVDTATNAVVATVPVAPGPWGVAVHPAGTRCYVASPPSDTVSVLDTATNRVIATVPVPFPVTVAVHPAGTFVYVSNEGGTVHVLDTVTNREVAAIETPWGMDGSPGLAVHPAGTFLYVANTLANSVSVVDTATNTIVATVPLAGRLWGVAVHPAGTFVYVTSLGGVSVIETAGHAVLTTVPLPGVPAGVAVHPAGTFVYVTSAEAGTLAVIETAGHTLATSVPIGERPAGVSVHPAGTFVYAANADGNSLSVVDTARHVVVATVPVGTRPLAFGQFVGGAVPGISLALDQTAVRVGDSLALRATTYGGATPRAVDAYLELRRPDGTVDFLAADGSFTVHLRRPVASQVLAGPFSGEVARYGFVDDLPFGTYRWRAYFTEPGTLDVVGLVAEAAFALLP